MKNQSFYRNFINNYFDKHYKRDEGKINVSKADGKIHNLIVCAICVNLLEETNTTFITQARLRCGVRPDVLFFRGNQVFIVEVRHTENEKESGEKLKKLPEELREFVIYIDCNKDLRTELNKIK